MPVSLDGAGCSCWFNNLDIVMNRTTKQAEQILFDVKEELRELCEECEESDEEGAAAQGQADLGFETAPDEQEV